MTAAGRSLGPLHGVPITIKEAWDWIGSPSTSGHPELVDWRPERNSEAIDRLLAAGAVIYGKTNLGLGVVAGAAGLDATGWRLELPAEAYTVNGGRESTMDQLFWAGWSGGVLLPGTVAPAGLTASGLLCGLQIVAAHRRDRDAIAFAGFMERELGGNRIPPGYDG